MNFAIIEYKNETKDDSSKLVLSSILQRIADGLYPTYINTPSSSVTTITLTAAAESSSRIQLMWTALLSAVSYKVYRDVISGFTPSSANEVVSTATSITLITPRGNLVTPLNSLITSAKNSAGLTSGTRYYYRIAGVSANGSETYANEANSVPATGFAVRTHAGQGIIGNTDADGYDAKFNFPQGLGVDSSGFLYLADSGNQLIRKISPRIGDLVNAGGVAYAVEGQVTTLTGTGTQGSQDGVGIYTSFWYPQGIVFTTAGNGCSAGTPCLYVSDTENHKIRRITGSSL